MPFDFNALAERAAEVKVGGAPVYLRLPSREERREVGDIARTPKDAPDSEAIANWNLACGKALSVTVVDHDDVSEETWSQIAGALGTKHDKELQVLVATAMALCGFEVAKAALEQLLEDPTNGVTDHIAAASESVGNSLSK